MNISMNVALTISRPHMPSFRASTPTDRRPGKRTAVSSQLSLYKGVSERVLGWRRLSARLDSPTRDKESEMRTRRWNGLEGQSTEWASLMKDPELWLPDGNCHVHLYGREASKREPSFNVSIEILRATNCQQLLNRFLSQRSAESTPVSDSSSRTDDYFQSKIVDLFIPAPSDAQRAQALLYHTATRNFFAWIFGKPLVGHHLGGALVGLLNSMNEFRSGDEDNVQEIIDYMDEQGYADMRNRPDHALAVLFFAEHFHFKDMWIDAFAHCVGMYDNLNLSPGYEMISRASRALITRSRLEMDIRLDHAGARLATFLEDDLSDVNIGLPSNARDHLDNFRSFLQSHFVAKLGYYPPTSNESTATRSFPKNVYSHMCQEFQKLYDFLVDTSVASTDIVPMSQANGICAMQHLHSYDRKHKYSPLPRPAPLLPQAEEEIKPVVNKRMSWNPVKVDKMKLDPRLVALASLTKATNRDDRSTLDCSLVRAYSGFEKQFVVENSKGDRKDKLSQSDARKVRWILVYTTLQTLLSVTKVPEQVSDTSNVLYNLCVLTAGCPSWKEEELVLSPVPAQIDGPREEQASLQDEEISKRNSVNSMKQSTEHPSIGESRPQISRVSTDSSLETLTSKKGTVRRALSRLGNMPELHHPRPINSSQHDIIINSHEKSTNGYVLSSSAPTRTDSSSSGDVSSSRWSLDSDDMREASATSSVSSATSRKELHLKASIGDFLDRHITAFGLRRASSSIYTESISDDSSLAPEPLSMGKISISNQKYPNYSVDTLVSWETDGFGEANPELMAYLDAPDVQRYPLRF